MPIDRRRPPGGLAGRSLAGRSLAGSVSCLVAAVLAACSGGEERVTVLAASSLTDAFTEIETLYEAEHPGVDVVVSFAGSSSLAAQIEQGAPADVFAAADRITMDRVADSAVSRPESFARNRLAIAVAPGNPAGIRQLSDLARPDLVVVLAAPQVPAGNYAAEALAAAGVVVEASSFEQNVRAVAAKVALGEADAGIVYTTDIAAQSDRLDVVAIDGADVADYPIAALTGSGAEFVEFVLGPAGREALAAVGFELP